MSGRCLIVTGGTRGIGAEITRQAVSAGWRVLANHASNDAAAAALVDELSAAGGEVHVLRGDIGSEADVLALFAEADRRFGRIDGLINNAGVVDMKARLDEMSVDRFERMMRINVIGTMLCAREAVKRMSTAHGGKGGAIVNVSSVAAVLGSAGEYVDYAASKGAIDSFTVGLAREVATEGIRVNAIRPGTVDTDIHASGGQPDRASRVASMIPMRRPGRAEEIASVAMFLLSDAASYMTGSVLDVSGGR